MPDRFQIQVPGSVTCCLETDLLISLVRFGLSLKGVLE